MEEYSDGGAAVGEEVEAGTEQDRLGIGVLSESAGESQPSPALESEGSTAGDWEVRRG